MSPPSEPSTGSFLNNSPNAPIGFIHHSDKLLYIAPLPSPLGRVAERQRGRERCRRLTRTSNQHLTPPQPQCAHWGSSPSGGAKGATNNKLPLCQVNDKTRTACIFKLCASVFCQAFSLRVLSRWNRRKGTVSWREGWPSMQAVRISTLRWASCCTGWEMVESLGTI